MPIFNATIDGQYPIKAGLRGLPAGEADSSFPEISFAGPNAPTQWRGTDARAFTEYLNNYTLQDNLNWTHGKHTITFGLQAQRMDADERERTYGSLATFGFSNLQTAGFGATGTLDTASGNAYASFLLGELNATTVIQDSQVATSGRFYTYAFWVQDDFKLRPNLSLNLGLRYDIMKPYTELYDRWSFMDPTVPNPAVGGRPGAVVFAGDGSNSCDCRTPIKTYYGAVGPRLGLAYTLNERTVLRTAYGINYSRRGAVGGRAGARNGTGLLGFSANASFPSPNASFAPAYNWNDGVPGYAPPPFFDPSLNAGFVTGRANRRQRHVWRPRDRRTHAALSKLERRRCSTRVLRNVTVGASYAGSRGDFLGGSGRGFYANQLEPKYLALGNLLTQQATPANIAAAQAIVPGIGLPYANFSGTISQMLRPFPQYSAVTDVYGNVARSNYHSLQITAEKRAVRRWPGGGVQLHVQPDRRQSLGANGLRLRAGLGRWRQRSAARLERHGRLQHAVWRGRQAGKRQSRRSSDRQGLAGLGHHAVPIGPAARLDPRDVQSAERRHLLRGFQPELQRTRAHQRRLRRWRRAGHEPADLYRCGRVPVARAVHLREHAENARARSQKSERTSTRTSACAATSASRGPGSGSASTCSTCSTTWCSAASRPTSRTPISGA